MRDKLKQFLIDWWPESILAGLAVVLTGLDIATPLSIPWFVCASPLLLWAGILAVMWIIMLVGLYMGRG